MKQTLQIQHIYYGDSIVGHIRQKVYIACMNYNVGNEVKSTKSGSFMSGVVLGLIIGIIVSIIRQDVGQGAIAGVVSFIFMLVTGSSGSRTSYQYDQAYSNFGLSSDDFTFKFMQWIESTRGLPDDEWFRQFVKLPFAAKLIGPIDLCKAIESHAVQGIYIQPSTLEYSMNVNEYEQITGVFDRCGFDISTYNGDGSDLAVVITDTEVLLRKHSSRQC